MGNHDVGRGLAAGAKGFWTAMGDAPVTREKALAVLDALAEPWRGADAEFDDEFFGETPLSKLVAAAFGATPEQIASRDNSAADDGAAWETVYRQFSERYEFS